MSPDVLQYIADFYAERWAPIPGAAGCYSASTWGRIRSHARLDRTGRRPVRDRILTPVSDREGYLHQAMYVAGKRTRPSVASIIAHTFTGPRPPMMEICHGNAIRDDNRSSNLRYGTRKENAEDCVQHGNSTRGVKHALHKLTEDDVWTIRRRIAAQEPMATIAADFGVTKQAISAINVGKVWAWLV